MIEIKDLLLRFDSLLLKGEGKKEFVKEAIKEATGISVDSKDIEFKNGTLCLNIKPIYKNEIFLKKEEIFLKLKETLGKKSPQNFR